MKEIEIKATTEEEALESVSRHFRMTRESFEIVETKPADREGGTGEIVVRLRMKISHLKNLVRDKTTELLRRMGVPVEVRVGHAEDFLNVDILSDQGSLLIGRGGETLDAIQHLLNRMINRNDKNMPMILVDVENYRARVHRRLKKIAQRAVEKVDKTGQPVKLEPMTPHERKFIHKLLADIREITTYSMGREGQRSVIVATESKRKIATGGDEEILPELLNETSTIRRNRPLFQPPPTQNRSAIPPKSSGDLGDLLDLGMDTE